LPFGVNRVEGERGFAGTRRTRDDRQAVKRNVERNILEVIGTRAAHRNRFFNLCNR
jgi:hypothetical protein